MTKRWSTFYKDLLSPELYSKVTKNHKLVLDKIEQAKPKKVLEIGSGTGTFVIYLSKKGIDCLSVDTNKTVLKNAKINNKNFKGKAKFEKADAFNLPFEDNSFDVIIHQGFFEHFNNTDLKKLTKEQLRVGRKIICSIPNHNYPQQDVGNERLMTKEEWKSILSDFNVEKTTYYRTRKLPTKIKRDGKEFTAKRPKLVELCLEISNQK